MNKKYQEVFQALSDSAMSSAEIAVKYEQKNGTKQRVDTADEMREKYLALSNKIQASDGAYVPTKNDIVLLLIASVIVSKQLEDRIDSMKKALAGYQTDIIPKLQQVLNEGKDDSEVAKLVEQIFVIKE